MRFQRRALLPFSVVYSAEAWKKSLVDRLLSGELWIQEAKMDRPVVLWATYLLVLAVGLGFVGIA